MTPHYLHLICDGNQLDDSLAKIDGDIKDMSKISKLQEYCTISPQFTAGAFHPKIILFTSKSKLLILVSSANATPSGILSNQDLIGSFYYDDEYVESKNEICSLFQYMQNFDGWGVEAREDFDVVAESFDFLKEELQTDMVLTIPNRDNLFTQIIKGLPEVKPQKISIYSPFFDDNYSAISKIEAHFKVPINIISPQKEFITYRKNKFSSNVKFYHSGIENSKSFHAKFYEFNYGKNSIIYWGSANCSYSGLLSQNRNFEFLIKCQMSKEEIYSLWGSLSDNQESSITYGQEDEQENNSINSPAIYIKNVSTIEDGFSIQLDKPLEEARIKGIITSGAIVDFTTLSVKEDNIVHAVCEENGLVIMYIEKDKKRISNFIYINNPLALQSRVSGAQEGPDFNPKNIRNAENIKLAFGYFNLKLLNQKSTSPNAVISRKGFWRLPQFQSRSHLSRIIDLESFIKQRVINFKEINDSENIDNPKDESLKTNSQSSSLIKVITRETDKLLKNLCLIEKSKKIKEIEISRWLHGIDILNYYILNNYLEDIPDLDNQKIQGLGISVEEVNSLFLNLSRISSWIILNLIDDSEDHEERIELMITIQDILLGVSIYRFLLLQRFSTSIHPTKKQVEQLLIIQRSIHLRHIINNKFPEFKTVSEHSQLTYESILRKLPNIVVREKAIKILNDRNIAKFPGIVQVKVFTSPASPLLFNKESGEYMELETILGEHKNFSLTAPLTKEIIAF